MIKRGRPRKYERGTCEGMDEAGHPEGYWVRCGKGLPPFAYEQDCAIYEENKDRAQVIDYVTDAGVVIPVMQLIGDGLDANGKMRTGGVYVLRPLEHPCTWESGQGIRQRVVFSPQSPLQQDWYFNIELRGELSFQAKNEVASCVLIAVKNDKFKIAYFLNNEDGDGGGSRWVEEFPFRFKPGRWYELAIALLPDLTIENTWDLNVTLHDLKNLNKYISYVPGVGFRPNRIKSATKMGMGDEQQGIESGGTFFISVDTDERLEQERLAAE